MMLRTGLARLFRTTPPAPVRLPEPPPPPAPPVSTAAVPPDPLLTPRAEFHSPHYLRHNARRLEHLASLRIPVAGATVLEVGAGIGDHSHYYLDRGCRVTITEAREENLVLLRERYPGADVRPLDMEAPDLGTGERFDVVHCYGLLYHLRDPRPALAFFGRHCARLLLLETCVSFGAGESVNPVPEVQHSPSQAVSGTGCRPTRPWVVRALKEHFEHVYVTRTQPNHEEFPTDWTAPDRHRGLSRSVFVCSREPLAHDGLSAGLPDHQSRHA
jgi:SAM-dependent methyltransferase